MQAVDCDLIKDTERHFRLNHFLFLFPYMKTSGFTPLICSRRVSIPIHLSSGSPFPDRPIILGAEAPENTHTVTRPTNGLPALSRASWSNRITTARLLSNAFSHTPFRRSLPTAFYIGASHGSRCLPCLGRETASSLRTRSPNRQNMLGRWTHHRSICGAPT